MAKRDYAPRGKKKKSAPNKSLLLILALCVVAGFAAGLYFLKEKSPQVQVAVEKTEKSQPKSVLPTPPEEVWSYIKALETRTVPVDNHSQSLENNMRLTEEQKKILLEMEEKQKQAELAKAKQAEERKTADSKSEAVKPAEVNVVESKPATQSTLIESQTAENKTTEMKKTELEKKAAAPSNHDKKFGLQCGAFKNREQAENMQARLIMAGFNARVSSSTDWNRVVVGPIGDRSATNAALNKAKSVGTCVVIGM
ncbi:cell division protein FtsN [Actinobacillus seminis]|uniref:cell division protein FtsN n=1 Tax=Actinobacillus seminis TaxID=722 RepID=UPI003B93AED2